MSGIICAPGIVDRSDCRSVSAIGPDRRACSKAYSTRFCGVIERSTRGRLGLMGEMRQGERCWGKGSTGDDDRNERLLCPDANESRRNRRRVRMQPHRRPDVISESIETEQRRGGGTGEEWFRHRASVTTRQGRKPTAAGQRELASQMAGPGIRDRLKSSDFATISGGLASAKRGCGMPVGSAQGHRKWHGLFRRRAGGELGAHAIGIGERLILGKLALGGQRGDDYFDADNGAQEPPRHSPQEHQKHARVRYRDS